MWIVITLILILIVIILFIQNYRGKYFSKQIQDKQEQIKILEFDYNKSAELVFQNTQINANLLKDIPILEAKKLSLESTIDQYDKNIANYSNILSVAQLSFETQAEQARQKYYQAELEYQKQYEEVLTNSVQSFEDEILDKQITIENLDNEIKELRAKANAAVEANRRKEEMEQEQMFYRIQLGEEDLKEIKLLREIQLRDPEPLNKIIWKYYYEKPTTDMIGRVIGKGTHIGIYKITNVLNGKCYVGQSVSISERWKQHIKRALGAEPITKNKLYPIMNQVGPENFTFEIIEECPKEKLDEREKYWQEYFQANTFGYSIK